MFNPELDVRVRGIEHLNDDVETPALDNRLELMRIIRAHVDRYLALYYSDATIAQDAAVAQWYEQLVSAMPKGVTAIAGAPLTLAGVAALLATFIYTTTVEHEIIDSQVWDYQLWSDVQPARVYQDSRRQPLDVYQRLVDFNFILNVPRTSLMADFSPLALDERGANAFRTFRHELADHQRKIDNRAGRSLAPRTPQPEGQHQLLTDRGVQRPREGWCCAGRAPHHGDGAHLRPRRIQCAAVSAR